jgi:regulator of protease activity HflC (stomatin/prohibitin superfamily)
VKEPILPTRKVIGQRTTPEFPAPVRAEILARFTQLLDDAIQGTREEVDRRDVLLYVVGLHPEPQNVVGSVRGVGGGGYAIAIGTLVEMALRSKLLTPAEVDEVVAEAKTGTTR